MDERHALAALAREMGVSTHYTDGLARYVRVSPETLVRVCAALGAPIRRPADAAEALRAHRAVAHAGRLPPVMVAWDGVLRPVALATGRPSQAELRLEDGEAATLEVGEDTLRSGPELPIGYHRLTVETGGSVETSKIIAAPVHAWRRPGSRRSWGVGAHLAALRSARSRSVGDLRDLESLARWIGRDGGDLVMLLPLLPTFNDEPAEPSPYSAVSRLFWSEMILDLEDAHRPVAPPERLDVTRAAAEVRAALTGFPLPSISEVDDELARYARFRGVQARLGRNWRSWPAAARAGALEPEQVDIAEERFHLTAQTRVRRQLRQTAKRLGEAGVRLGLDLPVGVHPDGYDTWSRPSLFAPGMSIGAPPDASFPSGQEWGAPPVLPEASRREGHAYLRACIAHQAEPAGVLRVDHVMALSRLYWIPNGFPLSQGTYVSHPREELFAVLTLESHRNRCEVVGENLGTVPPEIDEALERHGIPGMYMAQVEAAADGNLAPPTRLEVAVAGTHDTPTFAGWIGGRDIDERVRYGLLPEEKAGIARRERSAAVHRLAHHMGCREDEPAAFLARLLEWLGGSDSPLVLPWLEDLWLEEEGVNLPGTRASERPNWQRPMRLLLDEVLADPQVADLIHGLRTVRGAG